MSVSAQSLSIVLTHERGEETNKNKTGRKDKVTSTCRDASNNLSVTLSLDPQVESKGALLQVSLDGGDTDACLGERYTSTDSALSPASA